MGYSIIMYARYHACFGVSYHNLCALSCIKPAFVTVFGHSPLHVLVICIACYPLLATFEQSTSNLAVCQMFNIYKYEDDYVGTTSLLNQVTYLRVLSRCPSHKEKLRYIVYEPYLFFTTIYHIKLQESSFVLAV